MAGAARDCFKWPFKKVGGGWKAGFAIDYDYGMPTSYSSGERGAIYAIFSLNL